MLLLAYNTVSLICTSSEAYEIAMGKLAIILYFILSVFPADEAMILDIIDKNWSEFNKMINDVFSGKKITIKKFNK